MSLYKKHYKKASILQDKVKQDAVVGLRQVAIAANVSTATVSRAINTPHLVSAKLLERIHEAVNRLGWVPDGTARALVTKRSHTIGAVFPTLTHGDFARATTAIQQELHSRGYTLLLACSDYDMDQEFEQIKKFIERGVDGLILVGEGPLARHSGRIGRRGHCCAASTFCDRSMEYF